MLLREWALRRAATTITTTLQIRAMLRVERVDIAVVEKDEFGYPLASDEENSDEEA